MADQNPVAHAEMLQHGLAVAGHLLRAQAVRTDGGRSVTPLVKHDDLVTLVNQAPLHQVETPKVIEDTVRQNQRGALTGRDTTQSSSIIACNERAETVGKIYKSIQLNVAHIGSSRSSGA